MLMQEAFRRALDQREDDRRAPPLDSRVLSVLHSAVYDTAPDSVAPCPATEVATLVYRAKKLANRWCSYTRPNAGSPQTLAALQDDWVVLARLLGPLSHRDRVLVLWEIASAMRPETNRYDAERYRYLTRQAMTRPDCFVGLISSAHIPWPGPASFLVHALEELEDASAEERRDLHRFLEGEWIDEPMWLVHALASWVQSRHPQPIPELVI
jgi:hypothetical protein